MDIKHKYVGEQKYIYYTVKKIIVILLVFEVSKTISRKVRLRGGVEMCKRCVVGRLPRVNPALSVTSSIQLCVPYSSHSVPVDQPDQQQAQPPTTHLFTK